MESLRLTRNAVMSVDYDTFELMSLQSKHCKKVFSWTFAADVAFKAFSRYSPTLVALVSLCDANMALNIRDEGIVCYAVKRDVFENVTGSFARLHAYNESTMTP